MRDDNERGDYEPEGRPLRKTKSGIPLWAWVVAVCVVGFALGCGKKVERPGGDSSGPVSQAKPVADAGPVHNVALYSDVSFGDVTVTLVRAKLRPFIVDGRGGPREAESALHVFLSIKNLNPNRIVKVGSQAEAASYADDVGGEYRPLAPELGESFRFVISAGSTRDLRSDKDVADMVLFPRPVPGAKAVTVSLAASPYGGTGTIRVQITKDQWELGAPPKK